jgi:hypothetical protein
LTYGRLNNPAELAQVNAGGWLGLFGAPADHVFESPSPLPMWEPVDLGFDFNQVVVLARIQADLD